ncbi:TPA: toxin-activating lysine-acyltransferase [Vibrio vulnificus]|nr:toxin-activating lysine-acyltransferase [Vibrio vulnificus]
MMIITEIESDDVLKIYHNLGSIISILSQVSNSMELTRFDITNKILPAIRYKCCRILYNKNGHPVSFILWKKIESNDINSLKNACYKWHPILGWNEGDDYLITHFFSDKRYILESIKTLKKECFNKGDIVCYFDLKHKLIHKVV